MECQPHILTIWRSITAHMKVLLIPVLILLAVQNTFMTEVRLNFKLTLRSRIQEKNALFNSLVCVTTTLALTSAAFLIRLKADGAFQRLTRLLIHRAITRSRSAMVSKRDKIQTIYRYQQVMTLHLSILARSKPSRCLGRQRCYFTLTMAKRAHYRSQLLFNQMIQKTAVWSTTNAA